MLKKKPVSLFAVSILAMAVLSLSSCNNQRDPWWNINAFEEGTYYLTSIEGSLSSPLQFDASSYFTITKYDGEKSYELSSYVHEKAPNGLWEASIYDGETSWAKEAKLEWFNCYFAQMPSFFQATLWANEGQLYEPVYITDDLTKTKWDTDYPGYCRNEDGTSAFGIIAYFTLHQENGLLTQAKLHLTIKDVCDLTMLFSYV